MVSLLHEPVQIDGHIALSAKRPGLQLRDDRLSGPNEPPVDSALRESTKALSLGPLQALSVPWQASLAATLDAALEHHGRRQSSLVRGQIS